MQDFVVGVGQRVLRNIQQVGRFMLLGRETIRWGIVRPFKGYPLRRGETFNQMVLMGVDSLPIVGLISFIMGIILAMQTTYSVEKYGATELVGGMVAVVMTRELGPLMAAIILSGRVGAAIAAELGTMRVSEEIDALDVMALNPVRFLVVPRMIAIVVMLPLLSIMADFIGILGGLFISALYLGGDSAGYWKVSFDWIINSDVITGLVKSFFFALIIGGVGCYKGLNVSGGAEGVGKATTQAVVLSIFLIIMADCLATAIFHLMGMG